MKTKLIQTIILVLFASYSFGQQAVINSITESDLKTYLEYIASDHLKGRKLGEPELDSAAEYLVKNLKKLNLKPAPGNNDYRQPIGFMKVTPDVVNSIIKVNNQEISTDSMLSLFPHPENLSYTGTVVFAGYGLTDTVSGYNDYQGLDIKGKVVMMMSRTPKLVEKEKSRNVDPFLYHTEYDKIYTATKLGAKAIFWVLDPQNKFQNLADLSMLADYNHAIYAKENPDIEFPIEFIIITPQMANLLLKSTGKTLTDLQNVISKNIKSTSFEIQKTNIYIEVRRKIEEFQSSNIIATMEGSDPILKNEYIIYTAHYDHLGVDKDGNIFNGADDNGSGTVALLEIAEAFMKNPEKPKRSIIFAWMTAEEKGGIGSQFYINHPIFPLEKTLACINIDMIGRVKVKETKDRRIDVRSRDSLFVITCKKSPELIRLNDSACFKLKLIPDYSDKFRLYYSDQLYFYQKGIPVLFYHTGFHQDTHSTNDKIDKIDFNKMQRIAKVAYQVGFDFANKDN